MRSVSLGEVAKATGGILDGPGEKTVRGVVIDSRRARPGQLFVALKGENHDGHSFLEQSVGAGASALMVESGNSLMEDFRRRHRKASLVVVKDNLKALGDLGGFIRQGLDLVAVGITGSTGKTCAKDLLVSAIKIKYPVAYTPGNYNTEIGVPLTIFSVKKDRRVLVAEMGARRSGEITRLAGIVRPRMGIITNVGTTHLELFGTQEAVAKTKAELAEALPPDGVLFINADDKWSPWIAGRTKARVVKFGYNRSARIRATRVRLDDLGHPQFTLNGPGFKLNVRLKVVGKHQVKNALAAAACAFEMRVEPEIIAEGLSKCRLSRWRMEVKKTPGGYLVINDAYNANPQSMLAALESLRTIGARRRTIAVLGDMAELGPESSGYHLEIGGVVARLDIDILVAVGRKTREIASAALEAGLPKGSVFKCDRSEGAVELLAAITEPGDVILIKGSRVMELETVAERLQSVDFKKEKAITNV